MECSREEAQGAPGALQQPRKPPIGSKAILKTRHDTNGHQTKPQEVHKQGQDDSRHPIVASLEGQLTSRTARSFDSPGGATPVSAASHASAAFLDNSGAQPRPVTNCQPYNGVPLNSNHGQQRGPAGSAPQEPSVASPSAPSVTQSKSETAEAPISAAQPMSAISSHSGALSSQTRHPAARPSTHTASSADALRSSLPSLITSEPAANGRVGSDSSRQHGSPGDVHGPITGHSPIGQLSADSGHHPVSKPILKMKRTGQNFPISSPRSSSPLRTPASLHQRNAPSPNRKLGHVQQGGCILSKASESPQARGSGLPKAGNGPDIDKRTGSDTSVRLSTKSNGNLMRGQSVNGSTAKPENPHVGPSKAVPNPGYSETEGTPAESLSKGHPTVPPPLFTELDDVFDISSDDEIKYETTPKPVVSNDVSADGAEDDTSDEDAELGGERDASAGSIASPEADASSRQLFHPPEESDYEDETGDDDGDDDTTVSSSSSSESSPAADEEPTVALPSASIQHQQDYPKRILETAKSGRPYHTWLDRKNSFHNGGALFPDGYEKSTKIPGFPWICAVRSCRQVYNTAFGLGNHFKTTHKRFMFNDNMDGTLSVVGSYSKRSQPGNYSPVVVSRRPLDSREPAMVEPMEATGKERFPSETSQIKLASESGSLDTDAFVTGDIKDPAQPAEPPKLVHPGNANEMWKYIRPFLTKHRDSAPAGNWVNHVIHLPRVRDIKWNEPRIKELPYMDSHPRDITALIVQVTGVKAPMPCKACAQGRGPFDGCVSISPQASQESRNYVLACANCYYHCNQSKCSHCVDAVPRRNRERRERLTNKKTTYNVKVLSDRARGALKPPKSGQQTQASRTVGDNSEEEASQSVMKVYQPAEIRPLEMASKDRAYKMIWGKHGESISMCGALIPEGYDLDRAVPGRPWVCPIRSCRAVFKKIPGLGSHFSVKHRETLLNDNQNGTLSVVGAYSQPLPGFNYCAPLIISQKPLDENEPPMEASKAPGYVRMGNTNVTPQLHPVDHTALNPAKPTQVSGLTTQIVDTHSGAKRIWNYILPFLPLSLDPNIFDSEVIRLFALPLLQRVQWRKTWMKRRLDNDRRQIFAILVHVLGVDRETGSGEKPCSLCIRGEGPFEGCWTLPRAAAWESHQYAMCCANCLFIHKKAACSVKYSWASRCDRRPGEKTFLGSPPPVAEWAASGSSANGSGQGKKRQLSASDVIEESLAQRRRYERNTGSDGEERTGAGKTLDTLPLPLSERTTRASSTRARTDTSPGPQKEHNKFFPQLPPSALVMAGQRNSDELLEMEDWEVAPGRIREDGTGNQNNIAFSKSFLENNQSIPVAADVSFRVDTIKSGHKLEFEAMASNTRYCSVASGKLRVSITGQPEFVIGPHGVFKVKPGVQAWVQNRLYVDSVVHVVLVADSA